MKCIIFLALLCLAAFASSSPSPAKSPSPSTSADLVKKKYEIAGSKKRDKKKVEVEEEEEEEEVEEEVEEEDGSEYEDEYYGKPSDVYGGIKIGLDPWKTKEEGKEYAKKEPKFPPFGFDFEKEKEKKHKIGEKDGEFAYSDPKLYFPTGIYKDIPFKKADIPKEVPYLKPEIPKDIYKKEEKEHKAPIKPVYDEKKYKDIPFYGIPFLYEEGHKVHDMEDSEEEKIDPKLLYKEYLLGHHFPLTGAKIPLYTFDPTLIHELMSKDKKFKSVKHHPGELSEAIGEKKKMHALSKDAKEATSVYKADIGAVKKSVKS